MKRENRGVCDFRSCDNEVIVAKWNDNNSVNVASNNLGVGQSIIRFLGLTKGKKRIMVNQPHNIYTYNSFSVRCDQNVSLCNSRQKMVILLNRLLHLHRLQAQPGDVKIDHLNFRRKVALSQLETNRCTKKGRPSSYDNLESRFDNQDHLLTRQEKQTRCRICHKKVQKKCSKCDIALHMDCFEAYHKNH